MPQNLSLVSCDDVQYLFDDNNHMVQVYGISIVFLFGAIVGYIVWRQRKSNTESPSRIRRPLQLSVAALILFLFGMIAGEIGRRSRVKLKAHCAVTKGRIFEKHHYIRPSRWGYKYSYMVKGEKFKNEEVMSESQLDTQYYLVVYDSLDPGNSILDFTKPIPSSGNRMD